MNIFLLFYAVFLLATAKFFFVFGKSKYLSNSNGTHLFSNFIVQGKKQWDTDSRKGCFQSHNRETILQEFEKRGNFTLNCSKSENVFRSEICLQPGLTSIFAEGIENREPQINYQSIFEAASTYPSLQHCTQCLCRPAPMSSEFHVTMKQVLSHLSLWSTII